MTTAIGATYRYPVKGLSAKTLERVALTPGARRKPNARTGQYVLLIDLASVAALDRTIGTPIDPIRCRANVYFDGKAPWREHDGIDAEIGLGATRKRARPRLSMTWAPRKNSWS